MIGKRMRGQEVVLVSPVRSRRWWIVSWAIHAVVVACMSSVAVGEDSGEACVHCGGAQ